VRTGLLTLDYRTRPDPRFPLSRRELAGMLNGLLGGFGLSGLAVSLTLLDDAAMAVMNLRYLGGDGPTNILSFPEADPEATGCLGALYLSVDTLAREAFLYGQDPAEHQARLLAHGILHLAGYDHRELMDQLTDLAVGQIVSGAAECPC
jgi:probable rRNA maturation factor